MRIILLKEVARLGKKGDIVEVKNGYARNYLIPYGFALKATRENLKKFEELKRREEKLLEKRKREALKLKEKLEKISLTIQAEAKENDEIYGSISQVQIKNALKEEGIEIEKDKIQLEEPIKKLGVYKVKINLEKDVDAFLRVWVVKK